MFYINVVYCLTSAEMYRNEKTYLFHLLNHESNHWVAFFSMVYHMLTLFCTCSHPSWFRLFHRLHARNFCRSSFLSTHIIQCKLLLSVIEQAGAINSSSTTLPKFKNFKKNSSMYRYESKLCTNTKWSLPRCRALGDQFDINRSPCSTFRNCTDHNQDSARILEERAKTEL